MFPLYRHIIDNMLRIRRKIYVIIMHTNDQNATINNRRRISVIYRIQFPNFKNLHSKTAVGRRRSAQRCFVAASLGEELGDANVTKKPTRHLGFRVFCLGFRIRGLGFKQDGLRFQGYQR